MVPVSEQIQDKANRLHKVFFAWAGAGTLLCVLTWLCVPEARGQLVCEDRFLETLTAVLFLAAFLVGMAALLRPWPQSGKVAHVPIVILALLGGLDEVSFGQRWFGFRTIHVWGNPNYEVDGVHDVFALTFKLWRDKAGLTGYALGAVLLGALIGLAIAKRRMYMPWIMQQVRKNPAFDFLRYAIIFVAVGMVFDLDLFTHDFADLVEEVLEANAGLAMTCSATAMHLRCAPSTDTTQSRGDTSEP